MLQFMAMKDVHHFGRKAARRFCAGLGSILLLVAQVWLVPASAAEVSVELISRSITTQPRSGGDSLGIELSADGQWAVFVSDGNGLVTNDNNGLNLDVFLRNLQTGATTLVSRGTNGASGSADSYAAMISSDGRYVVFESSADNLASDLNEATDVFIYDRETGAVSSVSQANELGQGGEATLTAITPDARFILFESTGEDLAENDENDGPDLFLMDRSSGSVTLITKSVAGGTGGFAASSFPSLGSVSGSVSDDGRYVAHLSVATNLVPSLPANLMNFYQVYLWDREAGTNRLITAATNTSWESSARAAALSGNGAVLAFLSEVPNSGSSVVPPLLHVYDVASGILTNVPLPAPWSAREPAFDEPALSADGRYLAYSFQGQIYLYETASGQNTVVSTNAAGAGPASAPLISANGGMITFLSYTTNAAGHAEGSHQLYSFDRVNGTTRLLSRTPDGTAFGNEEILFPSISADGSKTGFASLASNLSTNDNARVTDVFVTSTSGDGPVSLVSTGAADTGESASGNGPSRIANNLAMSLDGRYAVFSSDASDLTPNDTNGLTDLFLRDLRTGMTRIISLATDGYQRTNAFEVGGMTPNGRTVFFSATESLGDSNVYATVIHDTHTGSNRIGSISTNGEPVSSRSPSLSADGRYLAFVQRYYDQLMVRDLWTETTRSLLPLGLSETAVISPDGSYILVALNGRISAKVDVATGSRSQFAISYSLPELQFSSNGQSVLFRRAIAPFNHFYLYSPQSGESSLLFTNALGPVGFSPDGSTIAYHERNPETTQLELVLYDVGSSNVSKVFFGTNTVRTRNVPSFSADGRFLALAITNSLETGGTTNSFTDLYLYDRWLTKYTLISRNPGGGEGDAPSSSPSVSADGRTVVFDSVSSDFVANDRNLASDVFVARIPVVDANSNGLEDGWEQLNFAGAVDPLADADADGANNAFEFRTGTDPKNPSSVFAVSPAHAIENKQLIIEWPVSPGKSYQLQHRASMSSGAWANTGEPVVATTSGAISFAAPATAAAGFYRLQLIE